MAPTIPRPEPLPVNLDQIPGALTYLNQWVLWRYDWKEGTNGKPGKWDKPPYHPNGVHASSTSKDTWSSFKTVEVVYKSGLNLPVDDPHHYDGVGFVPHTVGKADLQFVFGDLDKCRDKETGEISSEAMQDLKSINSYCEPSPSGTGLRFVAYGAPPFPQGQEGRKSGNRELYQGGHYLTITGLGLPDFPTTIEKRPEELNAFYAKYFGKTDPKPGPQRERTEKVEPLSPEAAERLQGLFDADPAFKNELFTPAPSGDRSTFECYLCARLWEAAFDRPEIMCIMDSSPQTKWLERDRSYRWSTIEAGIAKSEESHQPGMRTVKKEDADGTVGICPISGAVKKVVVIMNDETGKLDRFLVWVSDCAVHIHTETNAKDDGEFIFKGVGAIDRRAVEFTLPASALAEPRKFKAACINAFGARNRFGKLDFEIVQKITTHPKRMQRVEVPTWRENIPLLPGVDLADKTEFRLSSKIPAAVYDGDLQAAKDCMRMLLTVHKFAPILVATILGSPAIARWHKGDRFGLGLWGLTGTLKTTTALTAMGIYGIGYLDSPKLKAGKAGSTSVGAMEVFAAAGFLPQVNDDVKTVESKDSQSYVANMHSVLEGEEKARGKKDGGLRESREFTCTPISTGEVRPQEASTTARVMNLNWTRADAKLLSEVQKNAALLPVIGYHWLRFLAETDCVLGKDFDAFRSKKMEEFIGLHYVNPGRLATIHTLLVSTWDLLESSPLGDVFTEAREGFKAGLVEATATQGAAVTEETEIARFLAALEELLASNPGMIQSLDGKKTIAGSIIGKEMELGLFLLPTETLNELMRIRAFNQQPTIDSITQALNEKGLLVPGKDKLQSRQRINGTRVYGWYIRVSPPKSDLSPPKNTKGDTKNDSPGSIVSPVPPVQPENEREILKDGKSHKMTPPEMGDKNREDKGDKGDSSIVDRVVDSDSYSKIGSKSVPFTVPFGEIAGDSAGNCGIGPHPSRDEPAPAVKARLWDSIQAKMKRIGRKDQSRCGLAVSDLSPGELELITAAGWTQETTNSGISILWAPEKTLKALEVTA